MLTKGMAETFGKCMFIFLNKLTNFFQDCAILYPHQ